MNLRQLATTIYASEQITSDDMSSIAEHGIRSIINNRPDHEAPGQPLSADLAGKAAELGMEYVHIPVVSNAITEKDVVDMRDACSNLDTPILLFCKTGTRSTILWNLAMQVR